MRKCSLLILLGVLFFFTSCMDTYYVTKKSTFDNVVQSIQSQMVAQGFNSTGTNTNTSAMANNFMTQDTYRFADSLGNTMSYSVSYSAKQTKEGIQYVEHLEMCGCETSNPKDYERLCGDDSFVRQQINIVPKDQEMEVENYNKTVLLAVGVTIGASLIAILFALGMK